VLVLLVPKRGPRFFPLVLSDLLLVGLLTYVLFKSFRSVFESSPLSLFSLVTIKALPILWFLRCPG